MTGQAKDQVTDATHANGRAESPLGWLRRRKDKNGASLITAEQFAAGERLARDFMIASLQPRTTVSWSPVVGTGSRHRAASGTELSDARLAARQRFSRALAAVGPDFATVLIDVCCYEYGLETCEQESGWPARSAKLVLQLALTGLARHYGLLPNECWTSRREGVLRHWGTPDYRPTIDGV